MLKERTLLETKKKGQMRGGINFVGWRLIINKKNMNSRKTGKFGIMVYIM